MKITIDCASDSGTLSPIWNSTGFTPASLLLTRDMRQQVMFCGSVPRGGIRHARVHYLLELVDAVFDGENATHYHWSRLDQGLDLLIQNGMVPIFEIMGNPNGQFSDFNDDLQLRRWRNLVRDLALHVLERYGKQEVENWYFETWNEPDIGFGWPDQWPRDEISFCNYYDACADGLHAANPHLSIGGPATCRTLSSLFKAFLAHCDSGVNYFSHQTGTRLDFISIHEKAARANKEDLTPHTDAMIEREMSIATYIRQNHPRFAGLPFMNNECDPQVGWKDHHTWHATSYYASWICKSASRHFSKMVDGMGVRYALAGNDHGFIGDWGNRTLFARFGQGDWIEDGQGGHAGLRGWAVQDFATPEFVMVKKPAFSAMTLLSLLVDGSQSARRLRWQASGAMKDAQAQLDGLATIAGDGGVALLVSLSRDAIYTSGSERIQIGFENLPFREAALVHYRIDAENANPFAVWETAGAPSTPDRETIKAMRIAQEPVLLPEPRQVRIRHGRLTTAFTLPLHAVNLVMLLPRPEKSPDPVTGLRGEGFTGLSGFPEYLLRWDPLPSRAVRTYEVLYSPYPEGPFTRLPGPDLLCSASLVDGAPGYYRISTRDFWNQTGESSNILAMLG